MFLTDIKDLIIIFVKWIFFSCHAHPCKYKTSTTTYNVHLSLMIFDLVNGLSCDSAMKCYKIHSIFRMQSYHINKVFCGKCCQIPLIMDHAVIDWNSSDHNRAFTCQFLTEWLCISMAGKIHDCLRSKFYGARNFFHLDVIIFAVS